MLFSIPTVIKEINKASESYPYGEEPKELYEPIRYLMALGGKRMRPLLTVLTYYMFQEDYKKAIGPSLAVEVFHNFSLMHDDIMDKAPLRRGKPTVHEKWNTNIAILSGDVMLVKAYDILNTCDAKILPDALRLFNDTATGVCEGQQWDMNFETENSVTVEQYLHMIKLKTAVLLGFSMELGGLLAGVDKATLSALRTCGTSAGIGFQLTDDVLDVYGDAATFGKQVGGDILANKKTYLLIRALEKAEGASKKQLQDLLSGKKKVSDAEKVEQVTRLYNELGIREEAEKRIQEYFDAAFHALQSIKGSIYRKHYLKDYLQALIQRQQ
ncbi:MAG: polyprenyl synthetase family protein [Cytophagaceae bacterium]|jgi:geranylgeranyl diphosphate synthase type II|nr:polyprenyl synthetase family protein [Cytophagaceae bacterium]